MVRVLIADDHHVVRRGLVFFLKTQADIEMVGEASNGVEAIELAEKLMPDVILMDIMMPELNGIEATKVIVKKFPQIKVLVLTSFSDQDHVIPALEAGATGYQLKDVQPDELVRSIKEVMNGQNLLHPKATTQVLSNMNRERQNTIYSLTRRERDVLKEIANGKSNKEIASSLFITEKTVKTHVSNLLSKLGVSDRTQAALYAVKNGMVDGEN
ncbi:response regulator [Salirhabdus sp. Marseille-P4669]|uniref:response regulator n=1 Tax=Salirhabdus sp. Marseille-P4669 TaxID=2042310 RepID=UPI000C7C3045|nr:response regulator transcription factor [Salirhabdus sp. Marseille-P4669]